MALDVTLLTDIAQCDEVLDSIAAELDTFEHVDGNLDYADRQAERVQNTVAGRLAGEDALINSYNATLAQANLPSKLRKSTVILLRKANARKDNLGDRTAAATGSVAFLADVDAEQVDAQVLVLTNAQALVTAHRDTLRAQAGA